MLPADTFKINLFQSTPSARRATYVGAETAAEIVISIHALREKGDMAAIDVSTKTAISIHALREEGDLQPVLRPGCIRIISIHALREEGDFQTLFSTNLSLKISIHALREEGDVFLLSVPARSAISIHALREEGDGAGQRTIQ